MISELLLEIFINWFSDGFFQLRIKLTVQFLDNLTAFKYPVVRHSWEFLPHCEGKQPSWIICAVIITVIIVWKRLQLCAVIDGGDSRENDCECGPAGICLSQIFIITISDWWTANGRVWPSFSCVEFLFVSVWGRQASKPKRRIVTCW